MSDAVHRACARVVGDLVGTVVRTPIEAGGHPEDVVILLTGVVAGVLSAVTLPGEERAILHHMVQDALERIPELRLKTVEPAGNA